MYDAFYKFSARPFSLNPDPRFFFRSSVHGRALAYLRYGLEQGEGFVVISGEPGMGKTLLMRTLVAETRAPRLETVEIVTSLLDGDDVLRLLAATLDLPTQGLPKGELVAQLRDYLLSRARCGGRVLALIDEAHDLTARAFEELRMLSNFQHGEISPLQCFLLGHDSLLHTLSMPNMAQFQQRVIASCHLHPLAAEECRRYVEFRLTRASWDGTPRLTDAVFALIHQYTGGVPRRINTFCDRLLLYGAMEELRVIDERAGLAVIRELDRESPQQAALDLADDDFAAVPPADDRHSTGDLFSAEDSPDDERPGPIPAAAVATRSSDAATDFSPPPMVVQTDAPARSAAEPSGAGPPPASKKLVIVDEGVMDDEERAAAFGEADTNWRHDERADDNIVQMILRRWWPPRRRSPVLIAIFGSSVAMALTAGLFEWTGAPNEQASSAHVTVDDVAPAEIQAVLDPLAESIVDAQGTESISSEPTVEPARVIASPVADLNEDMIASIAPYLPAADSGRASSVANQAQTNRETVAAQTAARHAEATPAPRSPRPPATVQAELAERVPAPGPAAHSAPEARGAQLDFARRQSASPKQPAPEPAPVASPAEVALVAQDLGAAKVAAFETHAPLPAATDLPVPQALPRVPADRLVAIAKLNGHQIASPKLRMLLTSFEAAYQAGNLPQLTRLFASDARTSDAQGRREIARLYRRLFEVTESRQIGINDMQWEIRDDQARGNGRFVVTVVEKGDNAPQSYAGTLSIVVKPASEGMVISRFYHEYASR